MIILWVDILDQIEHTCMIKVNFINFFLILKIWLEKVWNCMCGLALHPHCVSTGRRCSGFTGKVGSRQGLQVDYRGEASRVTPEHWGWATGLLELTFAEIRKAVGVAWMWVYETFKWRWNMGSWMCAVWGSVERFRLEMSKCRSPE